MNLLRSLSKDTFFYTGTLFGAKALGIITIPYLTKSISIASFAEIDVFLVIVNFLSPIIYLGLDSALGRFYYDEEKGELSYNNVLSTLTISVFFVSILVLIFSKKILSIYIKTDIFYYHYLALFGFVQVLYISIGQLKSRLDFNRYLYFWYGILPILSLNIFVIIAFYLNKLNLENYFVANFVINTVVALRTIITINPILPSSFLLIPLFRFGLPFMFVTLVGTLIPLIERSVVLNSFSLKQSGLYSFAFRLVALLAIINKGFQLSWAPLSMRHLKDEDFEIQVRDIYLRAAIFLGIIVVLIHSLFKLLGHYIIDKAYLASSEFLGPLLIGSAFIILSSISNVHINVQKRTSIHLKNYLISLTVYVLIVVFLSKLGLWYVCLSYMFYGMTIFISQTLSSNRLTKVKLNVFVGIGVFLFTFIIYSCVEYYT